MLKKLGSSFAIFLLLIIPIVMGQQYDSKEVRIDISSISIDKEAQAPEDENTIFFPYDQRDRTQYFSVDMQIQAKPVNVILVLDESSSMNNIDIKDAYNLTSVNRMEIQKRIAVQILESTNHASDIAMVAFGGDEIHTYDFDSHRETLKKYIENMIADGKKSRGGEALSHAIDLAIESGRQCIVVVISDGLELIGEYKLVDVIGRAVNNEITVYSAQLGSKDIGRDMAEIAARTNGLSFIIDEESDISYPDQETSTPPLIPTIIEIVNKQYLETFVLTLTAPQGVYIDQTTTLQGDEPHMKDTELKWDKISYEKTVALITKIGVKGGQIDPSLTSLEMSFDLSFTNHLRNTKQETHFDIGTVRLRFETEEEYNERMRDEFFQKYKLHISLIVTAVILTMGFFARWKLSLRRQRRELEHHISQADRLEKERDFEGALHHVERALSLCDKLKDERKDILSKDYDRLARIVLQLEEEKEKVRVVLNEISMSLENLRELASDEYLQNSLSDLEQLEEKIGPHLKVERLSYSVSQIFERNDLAQIRDLQGELEQVREILSLNLARIQRAQDLYKQTRPTLEILLQGRNLDTARVSDVIEDTSLASLVLNFMIENHQELKSQWSKEIVDVLKDERESFFRAQELMKQENFRKAEDFLKKALDIALKTEQHQLSEEIQKTLKECRERVGDIRTRRVSAFTEGMELFKNRLYSEAMTKFVEARTLAEQINEAKQAERANSMIFRCEKGDLWEEQKKAIIEKMKDINGIAGIEWLSRYVEAETDDIDGLLTDIRNQYNREGGEDIEQYRVYRYENPPVFIDFYALSRYIFDHPGEIGGRIPPNDLEIPIDVQKELLELIKPSRGGRI